MTANGAPVHTALRHRAPLTALEAALKAIAMKKLILALGLALAACNAPTAPPTGAAPAAASGALEVRDGWASPTPGGVDVSAGYLTIANGTSQDDRLVGASSPRAARVEIHTMEMDGDVMRMRPAAEGLAAPAGSEVALAPHGTHLMFFGVTQPFAVGEDIPVELQFENAGAVQTTLPVRTN